MFIYLFFFNLVNILNFVARLMLCVASPEFADTSLGMETPDCHTTPSILVGGAPSWQHPVPSNYDRCNIFTSYIMHSVHFSCCILFVCSPPPIKSFHTQPFIYQCRVVISYKIFIDHFPSLPHTIDLLQTYLIFLFTLFIILGMRCPLSTTQLSQPWAPA